MPCYHPLLAFKLDIPGGKSQVYFSSSSQSGAVNGIFQNAKPIKLPCGRCIGCRLERSRQWATRCVMESQLHSENCFITLTYDKLPKNNSLCKNDLTLFFKRLRKYLGKKKIRYFACGEYGTSGGRPHYHAIIFGHDFNDIVKQITPDNTIVQYSKSLSSIWGYGITSVGKLTFESCAYVARYCLKKHYGDDAAIYYKNREPEYVVMSRRPGIASYWYDQYKDDVFPRDIVFSRNVPCKPPRYFEKILERENPDAYAELKLLRADNIEELDDVELSRREKVVQYKTKSTHRQLENLDINEDPF